MGGKGGSQGKGRHINWIIETKGREFIDTDRKDLAMKRWCKDVSDETGEDWRYIKIPQRNFDADSFETYEDLIENINVNLEDSLQ